MRTTTASTMNRNTNLALGAKGEGDVLSRFHSENDGKAVRRLPSWIVPENAFSGFGLDGEASASVQMRILDLFRDDYLRQRQFAIVQPGADAPCRRSLTSSTRRCGAAGDIPFLLPLVRALAPSERGLSAKPTGGVLRRFKPPWCLTPTREGRRRTEVRIS